MSEFTRGYITGILVYVVIFMAFQTCSSKAHAGVKETIVEVAIKNGFNPELALAVAEVESAFNPKAKGKAGEVGLFQLHPRFFKNAPYEVSANAELGIKHLIYWQRQCPNKKELTFINCFNRGMRPVVNPKTTPYYKKVIAAYKRQKSKNPPSVASAY